MQKELVNPDQWISSLPQKIKPRYRWSFFSAVIIGILTHLVMFVNKFPNHDSLNAFYSDQSITATSGRWFLKYACGISSYFDLPWVNGILCILYLALTTVLVVELFEIRQKLSIILTAGFLITFPAMACTFSYLFTADGYMLAMLMSTLAVFVTKKYQFGFVPGGILLCFALGIYQTYISFAAALCVGCLLQSLLCGSLKGKYAWIQLGKYLFMGLVGVFLYWSILQLLVHFGALVLTSYQHIDSIGHINFAKIPESIRSAYDDFFLTIFERPALAGTLAVKISNAAAFILCFVFGIWLIIKNRVFVSISTLVLIVILYTVFPISMNCLFLAQAEIIHMLMRTSFSLGYVFLIALSEKALVNVKNPLFRFSALCRWAAVVFSVFLIYNFYLTTNIGYFNMQQRYEKNYALSVRITDRIEQLNGFTPGMPTWIIGSTYFANAEYPATDVTSSHINGMTGMEGDWIFESPKHVYAFLKNYLGLSLSEATEEQQALVRSSPEYQKLKNFPDSSSVCIINHVLVIKLSDDPTGS